MEVRMLDGMDGLSGHLIPILVLTAFCSLIHPSFSVVLVLVFAICWTPFHIERLFFSFVEEWTESLAVVFNLIHVVSGKILAPLVALQIDG